MKTSLNELQLIENQLLGAPDGEDRLLFEARMILQPDLRHSLGWQQKTYQLVQQYGRQQLRKEMEQIHHELFITVKHKSFRQKILRLFRK
jgi:hypothetical protein